MVFFARNIDSVFPTSLLNSSFSFTASTMSAAAKKDDLPKLQTSLQEEINSPHRLKHAEVVCQNFNIWEFFVQL